jgi:DNA-directed RNA polymerase specialized sigma24 family protein
MQSEEIHPGAWRSSVRKAAINTLPRLQRALLLMHVNEGVTYRQIAQRQMLPQQTVLAELARAYGQLREDLSFDLPMRTERVDH